MHTQGISDARVGTRTVVLYAPTHPFLGTFGGPGAGDDRGELLQAIQVLRASATQRAIPPECILTRLDGWYGNAAPLSDVITSGLGLIARRTDDQVLDLVAVQVVLAGPPVAIWTHPERQTSHARQPDLCCG